MIEICQSVLFGSSFCFFFQAEDGIRDLVRSRGLGDVYKRQVPAFTGAHRGRSQPAGAPQPAAPSQCAGRHRGGDLSLIHI